MKSKKFWSFKICENFDLSEEILNKYQKKGKFFEDANYFYEIIGTGCHPSIKKFHGNQPIILNFSNVLVDKNTIKIIFNLFQNSKINYLKLYSNNFNLNNLELLFNYLINKPNEIYFFNFEWNEKFLSNENEFFSLKNANEKNIKIFQKIEEIFLLLFTSTNKLESICFRGNFIGDEIAMKIFENLKNNNNNLRMLNLFKNNLTNKCVKTFSEMLYSNRKLEEINLGGNFLTNESLILIKNNVGIFYLNEEKLEEYKKLEKEKNNIIKENAKLKAKKKNEIDVPVLDELIEIEGKFFTVKNNVLNILNLIQNNFDEKCFENLVEILNSNEKLNITINKDIFNENQIKILDEKYKERLYLLK